MGAITVDSKIETEMSLSWTALEDPATGNSAIVSYNLYWDNASGTTNIEVLDLLITSYTITGLTGGETYVFKVRAYNIYGYGDFSAEHSEKASDVPDQIVIATTSIVGTDVVIDWVAPDNNFETILQYDILFKKADGTYVNDEVNCDGSVASGTTCIIPMTDMITLTGLSQGNLVVVRVAAENVNGWEAYSQENIIGAVIEVPPAIATITYDVEASDNTQIIVLWDALTDFETGGSPITGYDLQFD